MILEEANTTFFSQRSVCGGQCPNLTDKTVPKDVELSHGMIPI